jgi:hypothetical protein
MGRTNVIIGCGAYIGCSSYFVRGGYIGCAAIIGCSGYNNYNFNYNRGCGGFNYCKSI